MPPADVDTAGEWEGGPKRMEKLVCVACVGKRAGGSGPANGNRRNALRSRPVAESTSARLYGFGVRRCGEWNNLSGHVIMTTVSVNLSTAAAVAAAAVTNCGGRRRADDGEKLSSM